MAHSNITTFNHINSKSEICYLQWTSTLNTRVSSLDSPLFALHWYSPAQCRVMLRITRVSPGKSVTETISKLCLQPPRKVGKGGGGLKQTKCLLRLILANYMSVIEKWICWIDVTYFVPGVPQCNEK